MRSVFFLLTFCLSCGVLDSVSTQENRGNPHRIIAETQPVIRPEEAVQSGHVHRAVLYPARAVSVPKRRAPKEQQVHKDSVTEIPESDLAGTGIDAESTGIREAPVAGDATSPAFTGDAASPALQSAAAIPTLESDATIPALARSAFQKATPLTPAVFSTRDKPFAEVMADTIRNTLMNPHGVQFGGIVAINWSGASVRPVTNDGGRVSGKPLPGMALGAFADVPLVKRLSFRPHVQYAYEGYQADIKGTPVNIHVAYLGTSLNLVYHTHWFRNRFFFGAGPYLAYGMGGTYTFQGINTDMQFGRSYSAGDNLRKTDYGAGGVAGLLMDRNFVLGARFDLGLKDISPGGYNAAIRTRSFGLSLLYVFRTKGKKS